MANRPRETIKENGRPPARNNKRKWLIANTNNERKANQQDKEKKALNIYI